MSTFTVPGLKGQILAHPELSRSRVNRIGVTLAHELGHAVTIHLATLAGHTRAALVSAWRTAMRGITEQDLDTALHKVSRRVLNLQDFGSRPPSKDFVAHYITFKEWIAQQFARYVTNLDDVELANYDPKAYDRTFNPAKPAEFRRGQVVRALTQRGVSSAVAAKAAVAIEAHELLTHPTPRQALEAALMRVTDAVREGKQGKGALAALNEVRIVAEANLPKLAIGLGPKKLKALRDKIIRSLVRRGLDPIEADQLVPPLDSEGLQEVSAVVKQIFDDTAQHGLLHVPEQLAQLRRLAEKQGFGQLESLALLDDVGHLQKFSTKTLAHWRAAFPVLKLLGKLPGFKGQRSYSSVVMAATLHDVTAPAAFDESTGAVYIGDVSIADTETIKFDPKINAVYVEVDPLVADYMPDAVAALRRWHAEHGARAIFVRRKGEEKFTRYTVNRSLLPETAFTKASPFIDKSLATEMLTWNRVFARILDIRQLADLNPHFEPLQKLVNRVYDFIAARNRAYEPARGLGSRLTALSSHEYGQLTQFLFAEREGAQYYHTVARDEVSTTLVKIGEDADGKPKVLDEVVLPNTVADARIRVHRAFRRALADVYRILVRKAMERGERVDREHELIVELKGLLAKPYIPFSRFGRWVLIAKRGKTTIVEHFESRFARRRRLQDLERQGYKVAIDNTPDNEIPFTIFPQATLRRILDDPSSGLTEKQKEVLFRLASQHGPERSFRQHFRQAKAVPGYSRDLIRTVAAYFQGLGSYQARLLHADDIAATATQVRGIAQERLRRAQRLGGSPLDLQKLTQIGSFIEEELHNLLNPGQEYQTFRAWATGWYLWGNTKNAVVNSTSLPFITLPVLAARSSWGLATRYITRSMNQILGKKLHMRDYVMPPDLAKAIRRGQEEGFLTESLPSEISGLAMHDQLHQSMRGHLGDTAYKVLRIGMMPFHIVEVVGREVAFDAAYRLARTELNMGEAGAYDYAKRIVLDSMYEYARPFRPRIMRGRAAAITIFWTWMQKTLALMAGVHGKNEARNVIMMAFVLSGVFGLPAVEDAMDLLSWILRQDGDYVNLRRSTENLVAKVLGNPTAGDLFTMGIASHGFGLGLIPGMSSLDFNVQSSTSIGRVIPGIEEFTSSGEADVRAFRTLARAAGAGVAIPLQWYHAVATATPNVTWKVYQFLPNAARAILRAGQLATEGGVETFAGDIVARAPYDAGQIALQALGFTPNAIRHAFDDRHVRGDIIGYESAKRAQLLTYYSWAIVHRDPAGLQRALAAIRAYNRNVPPPMRLTMSKLRQSVKRREQAAALRQLNLPQQKYLRALVAEYVQQRQ